MQLMISDEAAPSGQRSAVSRTPGATPGSLRASIRTVFLEERFENAAQFLRQVFVPDGAEQCDRALVALDLRDATRAFREVFLEVVVDVRRKLVLAIVSQEADEVGARALRCGHSCV